MKSFHQPVFFAARELPDGVVPMYIRLTSWIAALGFVAVLAAVPAPAVAQTEPAAAPATAAAVPTAQTTPPAMPTATAGKAVVDNPYGLAAMWSQSDLVAKSVLVILVIMSAASWYVIVLKWLEQQGIAKHGKAAGRAAESADALRSAAEALPAANPYRRVVFAGFDAVQKHSRVAGKVSLDDWIAQYTDRAVERVQRRLQDGLAVLATVGSTAPFVGLFGTVWGIYHALTAIGIAGQASIDKVAGPVGEALIMTAIGLAVAVPAVLGYNWLVRRNKTVLDDLRDFSGDVHAAVLASA
jgi:biopolymer transport protein ExbB